MINWDIGQKLIVSAGSNPREVKQYLLQAHAILGIKKREKQQWRVLRLDVKNQTALVISESCVAQMPYHDENAYVNWKDSSLRKWLNEKYIQQIPDTIRKRIFEVKLDNRHYAEYELRGKDTVDRVFLLSYDEAEQYFITKWSRVAGMKGIRMIWWLRFPDGITVSTVNYAGGLFTGGYHVDTPFGVRPAFYIDLKSA